MTSSTPGRLIGQGATLAALLAGALLASRAAAQALPLLDPGARSGGMGGAAVAMGWGGTSDLWLNPAFVSVTPGFGAQVTTQQLVPGLADVRFATTTLTAALAGIGVSTTGRPLGGASIHEEILGELESLRADGFGLSLAGLLDAAGRLSGNPAHVADSADLAWGRQWKRIESGGFPSLESATRDEGWFARWTPVDSRRGRTGSGGGMRLDLAYGHSQLDRSQDEMSSSFFSFEPAARLPVVQRDGGALRLLWFGADTPGEPGAAFTDAFRGGLSPLLNLSLAWDHESVSQSASGAFPAYHDDVDHYGLEATLVRLLVARFGYVDDRNGGITKPTWGAGLRLPLERGSDVRYDFASWPQSYPRRVYRHEVALRIDPLVRWMGGDDDGDSTP